MDLVVHRAELVGRDHDAARVLALLLEHRLVTVTGFGGLGKTQLALAVADQAGGHPVGSQPLQVRVVLLADVRPGGVRAALARQLGVPATGSVGEYLPPGPLLLVVDNCEHVLAEAAQEVADALAGHPGVRVLATSRESLGLPGERHHPLQPLALPPAGTPAAEAVGYAAVELFVQRARAVNPHFHLDDADPSVTTLVRILDGAPLALELAAARARSMTPGELLQRFAGPRALTAKAKGPSPERHRSLAAVVAWSYDLLEPVEQRVLERLGAFAGTVTLEGAEAVCSGDGVDVADVLAALDALVDRSLVRVAGTEDLASAHRDTSSLGRTRYTLLATLRSAARVRLADRPEAERVAERHRTYVVSRARRVRAASDLRIDPVLFTDFADDAAEVEQTVAALVAGTPQQDDDDARQLADELLTSMSEAVFDGLAGTVMSMVRSVLTRWPQAPTDPRGRALRAETLSVAANAARLADDAEAARAFARAALELNAGPAGAFAHRVLAELTAWWDDDAEAGLRHVDEAIEGFARAGRIPYLWGARGVRSELLGHLGHHAAARRGFEELLPEVRDCSPWQEVHARLQAALTLVPSDPSRAVEELEGLRTGNHVAQHPFERAALLSALATAHRAAGAPDAARRFAADCLAQILAVGPWQYWQTYLAAAVPMIAEDPLRRPLARQLVALLEADGVRPIALFTPTWTADRAALGGLPVPGLTRRDALLAARDALLGVGGEQERVPVPVPVTQPPTRLGRMSCGVGVWTLTWAGTTVHVADRKGLHDLAVLLASPHREVSAVQLAGALELDGAEADLGEILDPVARRAYRRRLTALEEGGEGEGAEAVALRQQLAAGGVWHGRARRAGGTAERVRSTVGWRLRAVLRQLAAVHPELGEHLRASVRVGALCSYEPSEEVTWVVSTVVTPGIDPRIGPVVSPLAGPATSGALSGVMPPPSGPPSPR
ncbi:Predicted ATPase [Quadrisphaera granulorum]|uniref:Putative ATPase n=1 Tax=Quadrisphaera granulorum TaxID=317664 RepID=A0A315ZS55_9ACTN|nr:hypothetical protein [Quadrisphaera granulorum]PWJ47708.1 putative ATPase [Quadrisphaera granulorum]SZE98662.1 Predicted ATPase [Quadrisphaera granulorum]